MNIGSGVQESSVSQVFGNDNEWNEEPWFENTMSKKFFTKMSTVFKNYMDLNEDNKLDLIFLLTDLNSEMATFIQNGPKSYQVGEIVLLQQNKAEKISNAMLKFPKFDSKPMGNEICISWDGSIDIGLETKGFSLTYQFLTENSDYLGEQKKHISSLSDANYKIHNVPSNTPFMITFRYITEIGCLPSAFEQKGVAEFYKQERSLAQQMIEFYMKRTGNQELMKNSASENNLPSYFTEKGNLVLGGKIRVKYNGKESKNASIRDVAPEFSDFKRESTEDSHMAVLFIGECGSGKSSQINALYSFLIGSELGKKSCLFVDTDQNHTAEIEECTAYCIQNSCEDTASTIYLIDTPGFCKSTAEEHFGTIAKSIESIMDDIGNLNAIVLTLSSNTSRSLSIENMVSNILQNVSPEGKKNLITLFTFSDFQAPKALGLLEKCKWPIQNGHFQTNNSWLNYNTEGTSSEDRNYWWNFSMKSQKELFLKLQQLTPLQFHEMFHIKHFKQNISSENVELGLSNIIDNANFLRCLKGLQFSVSKCLGLCQRDWFGYSPNRRKTRLPNEELSRRFEILIQHENMMICLMETFSLLFKNRMQTMYGEIDSEIIQSIGAFIPYITDGLSESSKLLGFISDLQEEAKRRNSFPMQYALNTTVLEIDDWTVRDGFIHNKRYKYRPCLLMLYHILKRFIQELEKEIK